PRPTSPPFPYTTLFRSDLPRERTADRRAERPAALAIDPHDLLPRRVHAARENPRLHRRPVPARSDDGRAVHAAMEAAEQAPPFGDRKSTRLNSSHLGIS